MYIHLQLNLKTVDRQGKSLAMPDMEEGYIKINPATEKCTIT